MKKILKILLAVILVILIAFISIPLVFKKQIMQKVKDEVNKTVLARVDWENFSVSLFKGFPDLSVSMKGLSVVGINKFEGDTLVAFDNFDIKVDLMSLFSGKIKVKSILLDKPVLNAVTLPDSSVNYDIMVPSEEPAEAEVPSDTSSSGISIQLKNFEVRDGRVNYIDSLADMSARIDGLKIFLKGDFSEDFTNLDFQSGIAALTFTMEGLDYVKNATLDIRSLIEADLVKYNFTFSENEIRLNDLIMGVEGSFGMPNDTDITTDLRFFAKETSFKSILSMIPAIYMKDFEDIKTKGTLSLDGTIKGVLNDKLMPKVDARLKIADGSFSYPDLPKSVNNVNVDVRLFYDGVEEDSTKVDVNIFHFEMAGNPFDMWLHIITPMSDMQMNGGFRGRIDLGSMADVVPLEGTELAGLINMDLEFMGRMSDIEKENYEAFRASGLLEVMDVVMKGKDIPAPVSISRVSMNFSPRYVSLKTFDAVIGNSDIHMDGRLENFIPYVFKNDVIRGSLNLRSDYLNISELMPDSDTAAQVTAEDTTALSVIEVPANIDFVLQSELGKILYDNLTLNNVMGKIIIRDGKVTMDNLSMNLLGGSMIMSGEYDPRDIKNPRVVYKMDMKSIDIPSAFTSFNTIERLAPIAGSMFGKVSVKLDFASVLDSAMFPVMKSIISSGTLKTDEVQITKSETFDKIALALKNDRFRDAKIRDILANFDIIDGRITLRPFNTQIGSSSVTIGGDQGLDKTLNYSMLMSLPRNEFGSAANDVYESLVSQAASKGFDLKKSDNVNVNVKITGTFTDPKIGLDVRESLTKAKTEIRERVTEEVSKVKEDVTEKANMEIDRIMKEAGEQAEKVKAVAKESGERLVGEAKLQGQNLIKEAGSNPLKKAVAEKTAAGMVAKAQQKADALNKEAEEKAAAIMKEAQKKADALKK